MNTESFALGIFLGINIGLFIVLLIKNAYTS